MKSFYDYLIIITVILYILVLVGLFNFAPNLLKYVNGFTKIYISFILLYKFNPLRKNKVLTEGDKKMVFASGIFLFLTTVVGEYLIKIKDTLHTKINKKINYKEKIINLKNKIKLFFSSDKS